MLEFHGDAICLSGLAGTKLKSDLLGAYYPFWWSITSGGERAHYQYRTAIVELHAGTGEVYLKDLNQVILGSAGHALDLKTSRAPDTQHLQIVLVEENADCCAHLKNVIRRRWPDIPVDRIEGPWAGDNSKNVYLLNRTLDSALSTVNRVPGNTIYFFDPLRNVQWETIEKVARNRIKKYYQTGTEFIIFLFTSDWFLGRDDFVPLPTHLDDKKWRPEELHAVTEADALMGDSAWRESLLCSMPVQSREAALTRLYKARLRKWFRYVLPLPFNPKGKQLYHLIICSNYEAGVRMTRQFYSLITNNPRYSPESTDAYKFFKSIHAELVSTLSGNRRPLAWKILWQTIRDHEDGVCDIECSDIKKTGSDIGNLEDSLKWLHKQGYLIRTEAMNYWAEPIMQYAVNWETVSGRLRIRPPTPFQPISAEQLRDNIAKVFGPEEP